MADFNSVAGNLFGNIFSGATWAILIIFLIFILGGILFYFLHYKRKFDIKIMIKSARADTKERLIEDKGAIFYDKKHNAFLKLLNTKKNLPIPPYELVLQRTNKGDFIELLRISEDEFHFLAPGSVNRKFIIRSDGTEFPIEQMEQKIVEGDIAYWNTKRKDQHKKLFDTENLLMRILPYIPHLIGGVIMIFMLYVLFDKLPGLIEQLTRLAQELQTLKGAQVTTYG